MLKEKLNSDLKAAMKSGESEKVSTLRMLLSAIGNEAIEKRRREKLTEDATLTDEEVIKVLKREAKKRQESIEVYSKAGRNDLAEGEQAELKLISAYLPEEMGEAEVHKVVESVIKAGAKNIGDVMKAVNKETGGRAPGKLVSEIAKRLLGTN